MPAALRAGESRPSAATTSLARKASPLSRLQFGRRPPNRKASTRVRGRSVMSGAAVTAS
jgi:hypothetical protein